MPLPDPAVLIRLLLEFLVLLAGGLAGCWAAGHLHQRRLVGGVVVGILLGPAILGQVAPEGYRQIFVGGVEQREALHDYLTKRQTDRLTLESTGVTGVAVREFDQQTEVHASELQAAVGNAQSDYSRHVILAIGLPIVVLTLGTAVLRSGVLSSRSAWLATLGASLGGAAAGALAGWIIATIEHIDPGPGMLEVIGGIAIGCAMPALGPAAAKLHGDRERTWRYLVEPLLYALVGVTLPLDTQFFGWTVLLTLIAFGDGRALGAAGAVRLAGGLTGGRGWRALRIGTSVGAGGPVTLAGIYLLYAVGFISTELLVALVLGNLVTAAMEPMLRELMPADLRPGLPQKMPK